MKIRRMWAVARKEFLHIFRDPRSLILALAIPAFLIFLFGHALTLDVDEVPTIVVDQSRTPQSRELISRLEGSHYFAIVGQADNADEIGDALDHRQALLAVVIPSDFARRLETSRGATVQAVVDGSDPNTATLALGYMRIVALAHGQELLVTRMRRAGLHAPAGLVDLRPAAWFNPELESKNFIIPGLIAVIMMVIAALLTSLTVSREWERGTMEQLISTPVKGPELILGKLTPYFAVGMADVLLAVAMGEYLFDVPLRGHAALIFLISAIFLVGALSMGILVSVLTRNQLLSNQVAMLVTFLPAFLLSGFVFPISNMPLVIQIVTYAVPARYFIGVLRDIYLKGLGIVPLFFEMGLLSVFGAAMVLLATRGFKKKLE